ncbi:hypothetical protein NPIL_190231 [Nephila pilipes]|uniref:Uncharacterized protein n=1 Tax=Nephila pilipes TaxID=299642 RepID=A0A8X6PIB3_NEPPI|nr:hypothetical protein NPIL_190231 [Nephila pilipes]
MEGIINKIEQKIKHSDLVTCHEISDKHDTQQELSISLQMLTLHDSEKQNAISIQKIDDIDTIYSDLTRCLLIWSMVAGDVPNRIGIYLEMTQLTERCAVFDMISNLVTQFFYFEFEKIIEINGEKLSGSSEIEHAEFFLSRCLTLCGEPTDFSFIIVASFLSHLVVSFYNEMGCFRIMYIAEFCFDVLYRRIFWKIFKSREDYKKLLVFSQELNEHMELGTALGKLNSICGENWEKRIKDCVDILVDTFSLNESERELFKTFYSIESIWAIPRELNEDLIESLESDPNTFHRVSSCGSMCYNYFSYINQICFPLF